MNLPNHGRRLRWLQVFNLSSKYRLSENAEMIGYITLYEYVSLHDVRDPVQANELLQDLKDPR